MLLRSQRDTPTPCYLFCIWFIIKTIVDCGANAKKKRKNMSTSNETVLVPETGDEKIDFEARQRAARDRVEAFERAQKEKKELAQAEKMAARYEALQAKREETMRTVEAFQKEKVNALNSSNTGSGSNSAEEFAARLMGSDFIMNRMDDEEGKKDEPLLKRLSTRELAEQQKRDCSAFGGLNSSLSHRVK